MLKGFLFFWIINAWFVVLLDGGPFEDLWGKYYFLLMLPANIILFPIIFLDRLINGPEDEEEMEIRK